MLKFIFNHKLSSILALLLVALALPMQAFGQVEQPNHGGGAGHAIAPNASHWVAHRAPDKERERYRQQTEHDREWITNDALPALDGHGAQHAGD